MRLSLKQLRTLIIEMADVPKCARCGASDPEDELYVQNGLCCDCYDDDEKDNHEDDYPSFEDIAHEEEAQYQRKVDKIVTSDDTPERKKMRLRALDLSEDLRGCGCYGSSADFWCGTCTEMNSELKAIYNKLYSNR